MYRLSRLAYVAILAVLLLSPVTASAQSGFDDPGSKSGGLKGGDFVPVAPKVDAGSVALGSSGQVVVLFRNDDGKPLKVGAISLYPSSNITASVGENQCAAEPIQPGEVCAISLQIKGLQKGKFRIEMLVRHEGRAKILTTTIDGNIESTGSDDKDLVSDIEVIPSEMDFGSLDESQSQVKALILRNKTSKPITIEDIEVDAGSQSGYSVRANCGELQTGQACVASVTWSPEKKGPSTGTLIVRHSGATSVATVELIGTYDPDEAEAAAIFPEAIPGKGLLISSLEGVDFGSGIAQSSSMTASLVNVGDVPLTITGIRMTNAENGVRAEPRGCVAGTTLTPLEACPLTLTWDPVREGSILDDVQVSHTGARGVLIMPLRGSAAKPVNRDTKAIMIGDAPMGSDNSFMKNIKPLSLDDIEEDGELVMESGETALVDKKAAGSGKPAKNAAPRVKGATPSSAQSSTDESDVPWTPPPASVDVRGVLEGYTISSYSPKRAIIAGPGGSRVVFDGEQSVIGGVLWQIKMRPSAVEFQNGAQKVLLLFDRSLSSVNPDNGQSTSGASTSTTSTSSTTSSSGTATP